MSNWGGWKLPTMTISYTANQYDCDGHQATTITLSTPISDDAEGVENETEFVVNAPHWHLSKYTRL